MTYTKLILEIMTNAIHVLLLRNPKMKSRRLKIPICNNPWRALEGMRD